ncbi:MAG: hypothetical protein JWM21_3720 [Acidobacteria bacterium]|nr:hypothetical protein [Acidobacteriota bacterium]
MFMEHGSKFSQLSSEGAQRTPINLNISLLRSFSSFMVCLIYKHFIPLGRKPETEDTMSTAIHLCIALQDVVGDCG